MADKPISASMTEAARSTGIQVPKARRDIPPAAMTDKSSIRKYASDNQGTQIRPQTGGK